MSEECGAVVDLEVPHPADQLEQLPESPAAALHFYERDPRGILDVVGRDKVEFQFLSLDVLLDEVTRSLEQRRHEVLKLGRCFRKIRQFSNHGPTFLPTPVVFWS
jgi:hypothetical protein